MLHGPNCCRGQLEQQACDSTLVARRARRSRRMVATVGVFGLKYGHFERNDWWSLVMRAQTV